jgi:outer membrane protein
LVADQVAALAQSNLKSGLDVSFANVNLAESKLLLSQARNEVRALHAELSNALGFREPQEFEPVETVMPVPPDLEPAPMIATALRERPDVLSLRSDHSAAEKTAASEAALWRPTVTAQAATGASPAHEQKLSDHYSVAGVNVSIPVFNGKLFSARRSEAELRAKAAAERLRDLETRVARDVQVAWLSATNAFERVTLTGELLKQASLALELAQARYDLGLSSIVELSQAQLAKTSADLQNASARYEFQIQTSLLSYQEGLLK